ncbi:MAG: class I SAM-dependent methyltransferase [Ruminococcus sp.]|nr:class I SAM-dependent methyltransferase [Ruminococcus sp.]
MTGYSTFARYYDSLTANIDYKKRAGYFHEIIKRYKNTEGTILLDLACGTGSISEEMAKIGYDVIGVDYSDEMLGIALDKKFDSGLNIQYLCQDMRKLDLYGSMDITICALDSINHLNSLADVKKVFKNVALFSEPQGLFIFDINTLYKHRNILANNTFTYETDNVFCVWENTLVEDTDEVKMNLEFFELEENGLYSRTSDSFSEKAYSEESIEELLRECGFELLAKFGDDSFSPPACNSQRIVYAARCVNSGQIL